jgi:hypothetical protein
MAGSAPKKLAAITTVLWRGASHARTILSRYFLGYNLNGQPPWPRSHIASVFTHQTGERDISREWEQRFRVPVFRTAHEALTLGGNDLAVDGVLLIGEHGNYPINDKGQKLYPRFELFLEIADTFRRTGKSVPVFNDKHLSFSWINAKRMYDTSRELGFPMMAGSSVPIGYRDPDWDLPLGTPLSKAAAVAFGGKEPYGYHMLEAMQSVVERRKGGESGVAWTQCLENEAVWNYLDSTPWARKLFDAALSRAKRREPGEPRNLVKEPTAYLFGYWDGLEVATFVMNGLMRDFTVSVLPEGASEPLSTLMWLEYEQPVRHFACLVRKLEPFFETGTPTYPVERTLLVSGMLDFALESLIQGYRRLETPELRVGYRAPRESQFCRGTPPWA